MTAPMVAIVDDEEPVRKALGRLLRASGFEAQSFASGKAFLDSLDALRPACLVLDLHMPGQSGFDVLDQLKARRAGLPTIVITGHDEPENEARCLASGAIAYMRKPVDDQSLLMNIDQAVSSRSHGS